MIPMRETDKVWWQIVTDNSSMHWMDGKLTRFHVKSFAHVNHKKTLFIMKDVVYTIDLNI